MNISIQVPEWSTWISQNMRGDIWIHEVEPIECNKFHMWHADSGCRMQIYPEADISDVPEINGWRNLKFRINEFDFYISERGILCVKPSDTNWISIDEFYKLDFAGYVWVTDGNVVMQAYFINKSFLNFKNNLYPIWVDPIMKVIPIPKPKP